MTQPTSDIIEEGAAGGDEYFRLIRKIPKSPREVGDIFLRHSQFAVLASARFDWRWVYGISEADLIKYRNYLEPI